MISSLFHYKAVISKYHKRQLLFLVFHEKKNYNFGHKCHRRQGEVRMKDIYVVRKDCLGKIFSNL